MTLTRALALFASLALAAGCLRDHDPALVQTGGNDCYTCHHSNYVATTAPPPKTLASSDPREAPRFIISLISNSIAYEP